MNALPHRWPLVALGALMVVVAPAGAQMTGVTDVRKVVANVDYHGITDHENWTPSGFFEDWDQTATAEADDPQSGVCSSVAYQNTQFHAAGLSFAGGAGGGWDLPQGSYDANSFLDWTVRVDSCVAYTLHLEAAAGDAPGATHVRMSSDGIPYYNLDDGSVDVSGQLPAGQYRFEGKSAFSTSALTFTGGSYAGVLFCSRCPSSIVIGNPSDLVVACNTSATFCVTPSASGGPYTYQWRNASGPLVDNGHFSGVHTACLTVQHACYADAGPYDVVVTRTSDGVTQPSKAAHLSISTIAAGVGAGAIALTLGPAVPNPFSAATVLRYEAREPFFAHVAIYDAAGRVVRRLADRVLEASGTLTWDGRTASGTPAVAGIYFLRVMVDGRGETRRIALVR